MKLKLGNLEVTIEKLNPKPDKIINNLALYKGCLYSPEDLEFLQPHKIATTSTADIYRWGSRTYMFKKVFMYT